MNIKQNIYIPTFTESQIDAVNKKLDSQRNRACNNNILFSAGKNSYSGNFYGHSLKRSIIIFSDTQSSKQLIFIQLISLWKVCQRIYLCTNPSYCSFGRRRIFQFMGNIIASIFYILLCQLRNSNLISPHLCISSPICHTPY